MFSSFSWDYLLLSRRSLGIQVLYVINLRTMMIMMPLFLFRNCVEMNSSTVHWNNNSNPIEMLLLCINITYTLYCEVLCVWFNSYFPFPLICLRLSYTCLGWYKEFISEALVLKVNISLLTYSIYFSLLIFSII